MSPRTVLKSIDENTSVSLKLVLMLLVTGASLVWWLSGQFNGLNDRLSRLEWKMEQMGARASSPQAESQYAEGKP